jgi:two-component system sensor histidine kinase BaeS
LLILLDNALRHTPAGGSIQLTARPQGRHIAICVADTGSGIAPEHQAHLFERFYRAAPQPETGGTGLGLAIAKGLIDAQQGRIALASRPGAGTQVTLTLPGAPPAPATAQPR